MKIKVLELSPHARYHFGKSLIDSSIPLSDTDVYPSSDVLFSALINNLDSVVDIERVENFVTAFKENKISISSVFYCLKLKNEYIYLLPNPANSASKINFDDYDKIKQVKAVRFIEGDLLNQPISEWKLQGSLALSKNTQQKIDLKSENEIRLFTKGFNTHVRIRERSDEDEEREPYQVSFIQIPDLSDLNLSVHFYFLYELKDKTFQKDFELAVSLISFNGLGGKRSSGCGKIKTIHNQTGIPKFMLKNEKARFYLSLSKTLPKNKEELSEFISYSHSVRGGRNTPIQKLEYLRMIDEGAILKNEVEGAIVNLSNQDSTPHYRYGKAFLIPYKKDC